MCRILVMIYLNYTKRGVLVSNIDKSRNVLNKIIRLYESNYKQFETVASEIKEKISAILENSSTSKGYNLFYRNSVHSGKYYSITDRVKKPNSLREKLIRNSDILRIMDIYGIIDVSDVETNEKALIKYLHKYDDLIGIKIVTELKRDCDNVYKLLEDNMQILIEENIQFYDFEPQPRKMKNGLDIYNIKGIYKDAYGFELQIKSKIDSAWGDIDHEIFYKNYDYFPITSTVQVTMNHVGKLLTEIENMLYSIRSANNNYEAQGKKIRFIDQILQKHGEQVKQLTNDVPYKFDKIIDMLMFLYESLFEEYTFESSHINTFDVDIVYLDYTVHQGDHLLYNYKKIRDKSFDVIVLEYIYLQWYFIKNQDVNLSNDSYQGLIQELVGQKVVTYILMKININPEGLEDDEAIQEERELYIEIISRLMKYAYTSDVLLHMDKYKELSYYKNLLLDSLSEEFEVDYDVAMERYIELLILFGVKLFNNDISACKTDCFRVFEEDVNQIKRIYLKMKELIKNVPPSNLNLRNYENFIEIHTDIIKEIEEGGAQE